MGFCSRIKQNFEEFRSVLMNDTEQNELNTTVKQVFVRDGSGLIFSGTGQARAS